MGLIHGRWCNAKTIPMTCRYCGSDVFYFSCNCGCKVFFDELGDPWPRHYCEEYVSSLSNSTQSTILIKNTFSWELVNNDNQILLENEYEKTIIINKDKNKNKNISIEKIDPIDNETIEIIGIISEIIPEININKKFNIVSHTIGTLLLKKFDNKHYSQFTVHSLNIADRNKKSYTFLVNRNNVKNILKGDNVGVVITGNIINNQKYWLCNIIDKLEI